MKKSYPKLHRVIKWNTGPLAENVTHIASDINRPDIPALNVLQGAIQENLRSVVLIGYDQFDREYVAGTYRNPKEAAYLFARAHLNMIRYGDGHPDYDNEDGDPAA